MAPRGETMIRSLHIKNFKSVHDCEIALGRINVFIGENGSGKTNILEALGYAAALASNQDDNEELIHRGMRSATPRMTAGSFEGRRQRLTLTFNIGIQLEDGSISSMSFDRDYSPENEIEHHFHGEPLKLRVDVANNIIRRNPGDESSEAFIALTRYVIYNPNILALRGFQTISHREPVGLYGEGLDILIASLAGEAQADLLKRARCIGWLDKFFLDSEDMLRYEGHKRMRSTSRLYFRDRYMQKKNNLFSAENANEGILHILFYLALFSSRDTPPVFGIDNIETALNPQLCRDLVKQLAELATKSNKQALITTHNPAILDGLNLHDDEQRLFVVSRSDAGHTIAERIRVKPQSEGSTLKLSELWMRGYLGGLPQGF